MSERVTLRPRGQGGKPAGEAAGGGTDTVRLRRLPLARETRSASGDERRALCRRLNKSRLNGNGKHDSPSRVVLAVIGNDSLCHPDRIDYPDPERR